jgi:Lamin Tail Domain
MQTNKSFVITYLFLFFLGFLSAQTAKPYDILISEFMPAPSAANTKLPNVEYIELYNRSGQGINLKGYKIWNGSAVTVLTKDTVLKPNAYVVIYTKKADVDFKLIDTIQVSKLVTLSNPSDIFHLTTPNNWVIDVASYDLSFYQKVNKPEAGLALERTQLNAPCSGSAWLPSTDSRGGTPGKRNSIVDTISDKTPPSLEKYYVDDNGKTIVLVFDKSLNRDNSKQHYAGLDIKSVDTISPIFNTLKLSLNAALKKDSLYKLTVKTTLKDCQNTPLSKTYILNIKLPEKPKPKELIINEILVNPEVGGSRFLELYNKTSNKVFDMNDVQIEGTKKDTTHFLLLPNQYVVLTEKPFYINTRYNVPDSLKFNIIKRKLPTWDEASGDVVIRTDNAIIDSFSYLKSWHNPLLSTTDGVSLEKLNPDSASTKSENWQSASEKSGFATPAQKNSQSRIFQLTPSVHASFWLEKNNFSPDDDGFDDALLVHYALKKSGGVANIRIYDSNGRATKSLSVNELLGTEGVLRWQGERSDGTKASVGIYIMVIDVIFPDGSTTRQKLPCALATQF